MAIAKVGRQLDSSQENVSHGQINKWMLPREKLEVIARYLSMIRECHFVYPEIIEEKSLPEMQENCFSRVLLMCESKQWDSLEKMKGIVDGLTDLHGNTIFFKYIREGSEADSLEKIEAILSKMGLAHTLSNGTYEQAPHLAIKLGRSDAFVLKLFDKGCSECLSLDQKGRLIIHIAVKKNRIELFEKLVPKIYNIPCCHIPYHSRKHQLNLCPIAIAVQKGHIESVDKLIKLGKISLAEIRVGPNNMSLLHWAIQRGQTEMLRHLLTEYFEQTKCLIELHDGKGRTPLIVAAILGDTKSIEYLSHKGANLKGYDFKGRTALHHAVIQDSRLAIGILIKHGACLKAQDLDSKTPIQLAYDKVFKNVLTNLKDDIGYLNKEYFNNYYAHPPENIVFQGGGPSGITHLGAIRALEHNNMLQKVKRVGGTSAGAITAALFAIGLDPHELEKLLTDTPGTYFLDHPGTEKRVKQWLEEHIGLKALKEGFSSVSECVINGSPTPLLKMLGFSVLQSIWRSTGFCEGNLFLNWMETTIAEQTGIPYCTFGEFAALIAKGGKNLKGRPLKHLHVFATKIGSEVKVERFSSEDFLEDPENKNLIMAEAVGASMSIPFVFQSRILVYKKPTADGGYEFYTRNGTIKCTSSSEPKHLKEAYTQLIEGKRKNEHIAEPSYVDGGLIYNFPIRAFDQSRFVSGFSNQDENQEVINYRTLGFSLYTSQKGSVEKVGAAETLGDLAGSVLRLFSNVDGSLGQLASNEKRMIALDKQDIGLTEFGTNSHEGKGKKAIEEAEKKVEKFFEQQGKEVKDILTAKDIEDNLSSLQIEVHDPLEAIPVANEPSESPGELELYDPSESSWDDFMISHGMVRTNLGEALGVGLLGPFWGLGKSIQSVADPIGFERDARWHYFRVLTARNPQFKLFQHINDGSIEWEVNQCFEKNLPFFKHRQFSQKVLPHLVFSNEAASIKYLSERILPKGKKIPINIELEDGTPLAHHLVPFNCQHSFEALIMAHDYADNALDASKNTILHRVAECGSLVAYEILERNQKIAPVLDVRNSADKTAILVAGMLKHMGLVTMLLEHKEIDVTCIDPESGKTLLHFFAAAKEEEAFFQVIQKAKEMKTLEKLIKAENKLEDSILFATENRKILQCLIENDIDLRKKEKGTQKTLLYIFSKNNEVELVNLFCKKLKENYPKDYFSILNQPVKSSQIDRTSQEPRLKIALIIATEKNNYDVVRALVEAGADFRTAVDGISPINYAPTTLWRDYSYQILKQAWCGNMQRELADWEKLNALSNCGVFRDFEAAKKLVINKILPFSISDIRDEKGNGLLMSVLIEKNLTWEETNELVLLILIKYPDQANQPNHAGDTPLMYALDNPATVDLLLRAKADPNKRNKQGKTVLHLAKNRDTIAALIKAGADPRMKNWGASGITRIPLSREILRK